MSRSSGGLGKCQVGKLESSMANIVFERQSLFRFEAKTVNSFCHSLESKVAQSFDAAGAICLPSASVAFSVAMEALHIPAKGVVLTSPFGWVAIYSAIVRQDLSLDFFKLDDLHHVDLDHLRQRLSDNPPALILVPHLMGRGVQNIAQVQQLAQQFNIPLIEDIAQSFGVKVGDKYVGSFGDAAYTSFNHHKILSAGDGGMAVFKRQASFIHAWQIHDQGCLPNGNGRKVVPESFVPGTSLRVNELNGAVLSAQYARLYYIRARVWKIYRAVERALQHHDFQVIAPAPGDIPFMALFYGAERVQQCPTLLQSGWHVFSQIPFNQAIKQQLSAPLQQSCERQLGEINAIGCGFIDKYFSTTHGIDMNIADDALEVTANKLVQEILC